MTTTRLIVAGVLVLGLASTPPIRATQPGGGEAAKADLQILLDTIRANRKALVATNLNLTDEESAKFWPIYERYDKELNAVQDRLAGILDDYTTHFIDMSDAKAMSLVEDYLSVESDRFKTRRSYLEEFAKAIPGRKIVRFYQIENKMDAVLRYDLAARIPVIEEEAPSKPAPR